MFERPLARHVTKLQKKVLDIRKIVKNRSKKAASSSFCRRQRYWLIHHRTCTIVHTIAFTRQAQHVVPFFSFVFFLHNLQT